MSRIHDTAIKALLETLADGLWDATETARCAAVSIQNGDRNLAIGTVLPLTHELPMYSGLLTAILALHRHPARPIITTNESNTNA